MNGLAGAEGSQRHALESARIFSQVHPASINIVALTIFPESKLYQELQKGNYAPASEMDKLIELKTFIEHLDVNTRINANTVIR